MKIYPVVFLSVLLLACGENTGMLPIEEAFVETAGATASFNFRNGEMREMLLTRAEEVGVDVWMIDERSIGYYLADGDKIDDIVTYVYAVFWVNN